MMRDSGRCPRAIFLALLCFLAAGAATPAAAAPQDVTRTVDGEMRFCMEGYVCVARAIGDVNGDDIDDIVFEVATREQMREQQQAALFGAPTMRNLELHLGPFGEVGAAGQGLPAERQASKVVYLSLITSQVVDVLRVHDLDADGMDDMVFASVPDAALLVLPGQVGFEHRKSYMLVPGAPGIHTIHGPASAIDSPALIADLSTAAADVDGDGSVDLLLGVDRSSAANARGLVDGSQLRQSEVFVMRGSGSIDGFVDGSWSTRIHGLGGCVHGLAGAGDVTGDGVADILLRRCKDAGQPTELRVLPGRADWPDLLTAEDQPNIVPPPEPTPPPGGGGGGGGGYLPGPEGGRALVPMPAQVVIEDIDGDGVKDAGIEFAGKTHLFHGGADIASRARINHTSGALQMLGFGAMPLTHSWRQMDLDGDRVQDLLLSQPISSAQLSCPGGCEESGLSAIGGQPIYGYTGSQRRADVIDARLDEPDLLWHSTGNVAWGGGDFNGDGMDDLLLGSAPGAHDFIYSLVFGPVLERFVGSEEIALPPGTITR